MRSVRCVLVAVVFVLAAPIHSAAAVSGIQAAESATEFYLRWRHAVLNAKSGDDIALFFNAETKDEFSMASPADRADMLAMMKRLFGLETDVKVVKETATPGGATLSLEGVDSDKKPVVSSVDVVKENGAWKMTNAVERWKPKG